MEQGAFVAGAVSQVQFDLLKNPFIILRIALSASKQDIADAFDEALADGHATDEMLRDARRQLLSPKLRLAATVGALPDAADEQRQAAVAALQGSAPFSDLIALAKELPATSRTTFLSNIAQLKPSSGMLRYFALTLASVARDRLADVIGLLSDDAGLPRPSGENIAEAFDEHAQQNAKRLFSAYRDPRAAAANLKHCLEEGLPTATPDQLAAYSSVVAAYNGYAAPQASEARARVEAAVDVLRANPKDVAALEEIESALRSWDELTQPAQLLSQQKGRDEPEARDLFQNLRGFMIDLANERDAASVALRLNKVCMEVFAELPRAISQLKEDLAALQDLVDQEGARDLINFVEKLRGNLDPLVKDLNRGFEPTASGDAKRLYTLFDQAVRATIGTAAAEIPWILVRGLALDINNDLGEVAASEALVVGLAAHGSFVRVPQELRNAILNDRRVLRSNAAQLRFKRAIDKKDVSAARQALVDLVGLAADENERREYQQAISTLDAARRRRVVKWVFWAIVLVVIIAVMANQGGNRGRSSYSSTSSRPSATAPASTTTSQAAIMPERYSTGTYSRGNVRYCEFESARLEALDSLMYAESNGVISMFNAAVDDYNARCARYRYYERDMAAVRAELAAARAQISADARLTLQRWRASY